MSDFFGYLLELILSSRIARWILCLLIAGSTVLGHGLGSLKGWLIAAAITGFFVVIEILDRLLPKRRLWSRDKSNGS